ncbi:hypothetical protein NEHOM01_1745 [Nematocida homosporus]|uniref:uncharacterized protein n=1 Tax=Nematocida homosporus TaxID=1912981 RepID=UPI002220DD3E|nr:uncharacterized protein NEHOM01_1745 [Nematocida homosporus]KAI5186850.1 hypothetical protein NEHOM01_1745 [Nematocida homosporus]
MKPNPSTSTSTQSTLAQSTPKPTQTLPKPTSTSAYTPEDIMHFLATLIAQVQDEKYPKYRQKLFNCYINHSIRFIQNDKAPMPQRFLITLTMLTFTQQLQNTSTNTTTNTNTNTNINTNTTNTNTNKNTNTNTSTSTNTNTNTNTTTTPTPTTTHSIQLNIQPVQKMQDQVVQYLCQKQVAKIRALILDLHPTSTYSTDLQYSVQPEPWLLQLTQELDLILPPETTNFIPTTQTFTLLHTHLLNLLIQDLKDIFIARTQPFGRKGNLLVINLLYLQDFYQKRNIPTQAILNLIKQVHLNFKNKDMIEPISQLRNITST